MKVTVVRGGGLAGTVLTVTVDTADLDDAATTALRSRVDAADLRTDRPRRGRADGIRVEVSVHRDAGDEASVVRFDEHDAPDGADELVGWVLDCPAGVRTTG